MQESVEQSVAARAEFLDRHPWLPIVLLVLLPLSLQVPLWLLGRSTDPLWIVAHLTDNGPAVAGSPWIDPNVGYTSEALGRLAARDWVHGVVPWWNPFSGVGMPLAGELQPASFFLPFTLLFLLPDGLIWQQICMQIIAGVGTYLLLRELALSRLASLMGGALYALNGTISWSPGPAGVYCGLAFLPLQLLGIEISRSLAKGAQSVLVFGMAIGWSILAGFPEPSYISGMLVLAWALYRFFTADQGRWRIVRRTGLGFVLGLLVATPMLIAFLDYVRESDSFVVHKLGDISLPWASLSAMLMPYIYGPIKGNYQSEPLQGIWGSIGGYCGILIILLATAGLLARTRERGLRLLLTGWVLISIAKTFGVQPVQFIINHVPLMHQTAYFRYSPPSWLLALIVLAAFGLDGFLKGQPERRYPFAAVFGLVTIAAACAWPSRAFWLRPPVPESLLFVFMGLALAWAIAGLLLSLGIWTLVHGERRRSMLATLLVIDAFVMFVVPQVSGVRKGRVDRAALKFLREHQGLSRSYALGTPISPNYNAYFQVASIDHNVLPVPKLWADYVDSHLEPGSLAKFGGVVFSPINFGAGSGERSMSRDPSSVLDLSVRYLVTNPGWTPVGKQFVPTSNTDLRQAISFKVTLLTKLSRVRDHLSLVADNPAKPETERSMAKQVLKHIPAEASSVYLHALDKQHIMLAAGQQLQLDMQAPAPVPADSAITAVAMMVPGIDSASRAKMTVKLCAGRDCSSGERLLSDVKYGGLLEVPLNPSLHATKGTLLHLTMTYEDGEKPLELYEVAPVGEQEEHLQGPQGAITDRFLDLILNYGDPISGAHKVYADALMDIWELKNYAPYFEVTSGGPCVMQASQRERVTADCASAATLRRRELFMPGWDATVNGKSGPVQQDGIFESIDLAAGHSQARFDFVPPHEGIGWAGCSVGLAGFLWQIVLVLRGRQQTA